jgi:hypothetical protein
MDVFFVQYHGFDMNERRARFGRILDASGGGALGVLRIREIRRQVDELEEASTYWSRLAAPSDSSFWRFGGGPAVRLMPPGAPLLSGLFVEVRSLEASQAALNRLGVAHAQRGDALHLDSRRFGGVDILLVDTTSIE